MHKVLEVIPLSLSLSEYFFSMIMMMTGIYIGISEGEIERAREKNEYSRAALIASDVVVVVSFSIADDPNEADLDLGVP